MRFSDLLYRSLNRCRDKSKAFDLQLLMEVAFHLSRTEFWLKKNEIITDKRGLAKFYGMCRRLLAGEPVAYILGEKEFYGEGFYINRHVLVPRPETEILVEQAINMTEKPLDILDIGTGSGVIAIILALKTGSRVTALDICPNALGVLKKNIRRHGVQDKVTPMQADLFPPAGATFDMIVSNPPYIPEREWRELDITVRDHEPKLALVAEGDGLAIIHGIAQQARHFLRPRGYLLLEMGYNQMDRVWGMLKEMGYEELHAVKDYIGFPRVVVARREG